MTENATKDLWHCHHLPEVRSWGAAITATITTSAASRLKRMNRHEAVALIDASAVVAVTDFVRWQLSARNQLARTVSRVEPGAVSSLVLLALLAGAALTLKVDMPATAVFKAHSVLLAALP